MNPFTTTRFTSAATTIGLVLLAAGIAHSQATFEGLGDLDGGGSFSEVHDVSANGTVIVGSSLSGNGQEAFRWTESTGMVGLGDLDGGGFSSIAQGVSGDGSIIVGVGNSDNSSSEAFRWEADTFTPLGDLDGGFFNSNAAGVSDDGQVIVGVSVSGNGIEAFRWEADVMQGLGDLDFGTFNSAASAASSDGSVVVGTGNSAGNNSEAFRWTEATGLEGLGDLDGGADVSGANDTSADGSVVVGFGHIAETVSPVAARWTQATGMVSLGDLPGGIISSDAHGVSADGQIVVGQGDSGAGTRAFVWTEADDIRDLQLLLEDAGVDLTDWFLTDAESVSANGRIIVGNGVNPNFDTEGWRVVLSLVWTSLTGGSWDSASNWGTLIADGGLPSIGDNIEIRPETGLTVDGPAGAVTIRSLTIGTQTSGVAELRLQPGGSLGATNGTTILDGGRVLGDGRLVGPVLIEDGGELRAAAGERLQLEGGEVDNAGLIEAIGGATPAEIEFDSAVTNSAATGNLVARDAILRFHDSLTNDSAVSVSFGTTDLFGEVTNNAAGTIAVAGNSNLTFYDDVANDGTLNVFTGSTAVFFGDLSGNGNSGGGDVQALGGISPGSSPGSMEFGGNLTFGPATELLIELAGTSSGMFDRVEVAGDAALDGTLVVSLLGGFTAPLGSQFEILDVAGTLSGEFVGLGEGATLAATGGGQFQISYAGGGVTLTAVPEPSGVLLLAAAGLVVPMRRRRRSGV